MRLQLSKLELAKTDIEAYRQSVGKEFKMPYSYNRALKDSAYEFHRRHERLDLADEYFMRQIGGHPKLKNQKRIDDARQQLAIFAHEYVRLGCRCVKILDGIVYRLEEDFELSGQVSRLDLASDGNSYAAWTFVMKETSWQNELRMPLIQSYYAEELAAPLDEVSVGVCNLTTGEHASKVFTEQEVAAAREEALRLMRSL